MLGGACTIIGTSTNLIVDGVAQEHGLAPFGIFESTAPGIIVGLLGIAYLVVMAALDLMPIAGLAVAGAVSVMALRCIEPEEAHRMIDWRILFLIFGMLAIGQAMEAAGAAALLVSQLSGPASLFGPWFMLALVYALAPGLPGL